MRHTSLVSFGLVFFLMSCGGGGGPEDAGPDDSGTGVCTADSMCDDGLFCNGAETCDPSDARADGTGCVPGESTCLAAQTCDEMGDRCETSCDVGGDADGDGHDAIDCGGDDCDDADAARFPGNVEVCDLEGHDEDCDPTTLGFRDLDGDGHTDAACCNAQADGSTLCGTDCDDSRRATNPDVPEVCNGRDDNCDGAIDEGVLVDGFADLDGDLHGDPDAPMRACGGAVGFSTVGDDCDDDDRRTHGAAVEICDAVDNDCDGDVDESTRPVTWYIDADGDHFGDARGGTMVACDPPAGYALLPLDCDASDVNVYPGAPELCNGKDDDCTGPLDFQIGPNDFEDDDGDGFVDRGCAGVGNDCDDSDAYSFPGATALCDGRDNDCDGTVDTDGAEVAWTLDTDGDGYGDDSTATMSCEISATASTTTATARRMKRRSVTSATRWRVA
jgi:hypothetical protein